MQVEQNISSCRAKTEILQSMKIITKGNYFLGFCFLDMDLKNLGKTEERKLRRT
jgi:hypothetical protein